LIRVVCPQCQAKLDAKDHLVGQTRNCPRCGSPIVIAASGGEGPTDASAPALAPEGEAILAFADPVRFEVEAPRRLNRSNHYLVCDRNRVIAAWENNGQGWRVKTDFGFASAARNPERLPSQGDFKLVELRTKHGEEELRLHGLRVYQLALRWALSTLERGDDAIFPTITGPGFLSRAQKDAVRAYLQERFMRTVWGDAADVLEYLGNDDYHSPGAGA